MLASFYMILFWKKYGFVKMINLQKDKLETMLKY